jgi:diadenosine tetraphosphate (Ap4A) HIT family hydrolase
MPTGIHRKIRSAETGNLEQAIIKLPSGWLVAGDTQPLEGYCVLLHDPVVEDFNALAESERAQYALDMGRVGDALKAELGAYRINYETWGNLDPALHTHIVPRYMNEDPAKRVQTPRQAYDWNNARTFQTQTDRLWMDKIRIYLKVVSR